MYSDLICSIVFLTCGDKNNSSKDELRARRSV